MLKLSDSRIGSRNVEPDVSREAKDGNVVMQKLLERISFKEFGRVPSRIRTDDIQNHNLTL